MKKQKGAYRRGGMSLTLFTVIALLLAYLTGALPVALGSIALFGPGGGLVLILLN